MYASFNWTYKEVYNRIENKGKSKKLALIGVANKLLKQSFVIVKSGRPYDETYLFILRKLIKGKRNKKAQESDFRSFEPRIVVSQIEEEFVYFLLQFFV